MADSHDSVASREYLGLGACWYEHMSKILVVDDDKNSARMLSIRLKARQHEVLVAHDALDGLSLAKLTKPDLVVFDTGMPAAGGFNLAGSIQNLISTDRIPFIFLSVSKDSEYGKRAADLCATAYFESSYETEELLSAIDKMLGH